MSFNTTCIYILAGFFWWLVLKQLLATQAFQTPLNTVAPNGGSILNCIANIRSHDDPTTFRRLNHLYAHLLDAPNHDNEWYDDNYKQQDNIIAITGPNAIRWQRPSETSATQLKMVSFYRFCSLPNLETLRDSLFDQLQTIPGLRGSIYVAQEGINGQLAVPIERDNLKVLPDILTGLTPLHPEDFNWGQVVDSTVPTFQKLIVRTRNAILRDGIHTLQDSGTTTGLDWQDPGEELSPAEWDAALRSSLTLDDKRHQRPLILDCRNEYESQQGSFRGAVPLNTTTFSETWEQLQSIIADDAHKNQPVYIFCTGGIRCVKVGAYLRQELGFRHVKRLQHGIIGYQRWGEEKQTQNKNDEQEVKGNDKNEALWKGTNFLFDKRRFANNSNETGNAILPKGDG